jgi:hypothetical protein
VIARVEERKTWRHAEEGEDEDKGSKRSRVEKASALG